MAVVSIIRRTSFPQRRSSDLTPLAACPSPEEREPRLTPYCSTVYGARFEKPPPPKNADAVHGRAIRDRKSTRLNSSHAEISYAVLCFKINRCVTHPPRARQLA